MFKIMNGKAPNYLIKLIPKYESAIRRKISSIPSYKSFFLRPFTKSIKTCICFIYNISLKVVSQMNCGNVLKVSNEIKQYGKNMIVKSH